MKPSETKGTSKTHPSPVPDMNANDQARVTDGNGWRYSLFDVLHMADASLMVLQESAIGLKQQAVGFGILAFWLLTAVC